MKTKLFTLCLALTVSVGIMFAYDARIDNLFYNFNATNKTAEVVGPDVSWGEVYRANTTIVIIPEYITYNSKTYQVVSIGNGAFYGCANMTSVTIPNSVTSIGTSAFWKCTGLTSIEIPNSVTSIGPSTFGYSGLISITIPNSVTSIEKNTFFYCNSLTSITIPNSVTSIGNFAFDGCSSLTSVTIPNSVTSIGEDAFCGCSSLTSITIPNSVTSIGRYAFCRCSSLTSITIPNSVTSIGDRTFQDCSGLTSVIIPESVTSIEEKAFYGCSNLYFVDIPNNVETIGKDAFSDMTYIRYSGNATGSPWGARDVIHDDSVYLDGFLIYSNETKTELIACLPNAPKEITIPNSVTKIRNYAFSGRSNITSIIIPNSIDTIGEEVFRNCVGLTSITIPENVTYIADNAFQGCNNITSVIWNAKSCNGYNFGSQVETITFGDEVEIIPASICSGMQNISNIIIPNSVTSIGDNAFKDCLGLTSIPMQNNIVSIGDNAFSGCVNLKEIYFTSSLEDWCNKSWSPNQISTAYDLYIQGTKATDLRIPSSITQIKYNAFRNCIGLTSLEIGSNVNSIESFAFYGCNNLRSVIIGNSVRSISKDAFGCEPITGDDYPTLSFTGSLEEWCNKSWSPNRIFAECILKIQNVQVTIARIPEGVSKIKDAAFYGCSILSVIIPNSVTHIGTNAFDSCTKLKHVTIGANVKDIGKDAFSNCPNIYSVAWNAKNCTSWGFGSNVTSFTLGSDVEVIPDGLCYGMYLLNNVNIPNGVISIGNSAFYGCSGLTSITIPNSTIYIGSNAFANCTGVPLLDIPNNVTKIGENAFENVQMIRYCGIAQGQPWGAKNREWTTSDAQKGDLYYNMDYCDQIAKVTYKSTEEYFESDCWMSTDLDGRPQQYCEVKRYPEYNKDWNISTVNIPANINYSTTICDVAEIEEFAFFRCISLSTVTIPCNVTTIGGGAFAFCSSLNSVTCYAIEPPEMDTAIYNYEWYTTAVNTSWRQDYTSPSHYGVFEGIDCSQIPLYVPRGSVAAYKAAEQWKQFNVQPIDVDIYTVTFKDWDGSVVKTTRVLKGNSAVAPKNMVRTGYTFTGWDKNYNNVQTDIVVTAQYSKHQPITVRLNPTDVTLWHWTKVCLWAWTSDGNLFNAWPGITVNKDEEGWYSYTFDDTVTNVNIIWNNGSNQNKTVDIIGVAASTCYALKDIIGNVITVSVENCPESTIVTPIYYTVTFKDWDGTVLKTQQVEEGNAAIAPTNPTRDGYTFTGWDKDFGNVTSDLIVTAQYTQNATIPTCYTVTFKDWDGAILKSQQVEEGQAAIAPTNPTRDGYTFTGWDKDFSNVTSDLIVTALYLINTSSDNPFVGFEADNRLPEQINEEDLIKNLVNMTVTATPSNSYKHTINLINGGEGTFTMGGVIFAFTNEEAGKIAYKTYANYIQPNGINREIRIPTQTGEQVKFVLIEACDGILVNGVSTNFAAGENILTSQNGTIILTNPTGKPKISAIVPYNNTPVVPTYYTVTFKDWDGAILKSQQVEEGQAAIAPANPTRDGYTFTGWDKDFSNVTSDLIVTALYQYNTHSDVCGLLAKVQAISQNEATLIGEFSGTPSISLSSSSAVYNEEMGYKLGGAGSHLGATFGAGQTLQANDVVTVFVTKTSSKMQIYADNGQTLLAETDRVTLGENTFVLDQSANGAQGVYVCRVGDSQYNSYIAYISVERECVGVNKYTVTFKDWDGTLLKSQQVEEGHAATAPANPTRENFTFVGWDKDFSSITENTTVTAQYEHTGPIAEKTDSTTISATVTTDGSVILIWPEVAGADTYVIDIYKDGVLLCTLTFNAQGQMLTLRFAAPARNGSKNVSAATQTMGGWKYVLTGLETGAQYTYRVTAKDSNEETQYTESIIFTIGTATAVESINYYNSETPRKILRNGQIFILRGDKIYTLQGQEVK